MGRARYDGLAEWYDAEFCETDSGRRTRALALRLLGEGSGRLLDVGCGTGAHTAAFRELGWNVTGVDISRDQLRLARRRGLHVVEASAAAMPFPEGVFDAAVSLFTHTDVDDFAAVAREMARVLRPGAPVVYVGVHPCFVGPHSRFVRAEGVPELQAGYWQTGRYTDAPGLNPEGLRAKVGATHLPLGRFLQAFLEAELRIEQVEEPETGEYPHMLALRAQR